MSTYCCGCAYRFPEPDNGTRLAASSYDTLRQWQLREMAPRLIGLPVFINHEMGDNDAPRTSIVKGNRALGHITHAWVDPKDGSLHWIGLLTFLPEDRIVMTMYDAGLIPMCSLQHTVSELHRPPYIITPIEISICHRGRRPGTYIYRGGNIDAYMRNNGYGVIVKAMADIVLPDSTALFAEAARVTEANVRHAADNAEIVNLRAKLQIAQEEKSELSKTILAHESAISMHQAEALDELNEAKAIFTAMAHQVFPDTFDSIILPPISIAASSTRSDIVSYTKKIKKANAMMEARKAAQETIAAGRPVVITASVKRPAETQSMRMSETPSYSNPAASGAKFLKVFDLDHQHVPTF